MKNFLLKLLVVLSLGMVAGGVLAAPVTGALTPQVAEAADTPPAPPNTPSRAGWSFNLIFTWVITNGITSQPADANFVEGTSAKINFASTYDKKVWPVDINDVTGVTTQIYRNGAWSAYSAAPTIAKKAPTANITMDLGSNLPVGTYYFQFTVNYNGGIRNAYSERIKVTIVPAPEDAVSIRPVPHRSVIFWGESTDIDANLLPENSTSVVTWTPPAANMGSLAVTTGLVTRFASTLIDANATDERLNNDNGLPATIGATATNTVRPGTVNGSTQVIVGGLVKQDAIAGRSFSYTPAALDGITFPQGMTPSYQWTVYDANRQKITTSAVLSNPSFSWASVTKPSVSDHYYLQLNIILKGSGNTITWRSNMAPLTVTTPQSRLIAVPNLRFLNYVNGAFRTPTIADFYQAGGVTLRYSASAAQIGNGTYDGNNTGFLAVQTVGQNWNLSVQASGFTHQLSGLSLPTNPTLTLAVPLANGGSQVVSVPTGDAAAPVTVLANQTTNYSGNLNSATTLQVPQTSFMLTGNYQSNLTWTLTQAP